MTIEAKNLATTQDFKQFLKPAEAAPIFDEMARVSVVQQLAKKVELGPTGVSIPFWDGEVTASWVKETGKKPLTKGGFDQFTITPEKIAVIIPMSAEVVRANPLNYIQIMKQKVAEAFAVAFDRAVLHGTNTPFGSYVDQTTKTSALVTGSQANAYKGINNGLALLANDDKKWTGSLFDIKTEPILNDSVDNNNRPLFIESTYTETNSLTRTGRILGRPALIAEKIKNDTTLGYIGDFSKIFWGQVGAISYDVSDQATLDLSDAQDGSKIVSLWQHNLVAIRCEAEFAAHVRDPEAFVKITERA